MQPAPATVEHLGDVLDVFLHEMLDVPLVAPLRPAALVVTSRCLVRIVAELLQPPGAQPVQLTLLPPDDGDDRPVGTRDNTHERCEEELVADLESIRNRLRERQRRPEIVETCGEHHHAARPVAVEVVVEPARDPLEVRLERAALLVGEVLSVDLLGSAQQCAHPRLRVTGGRHLRRVEIQVQARGAPVLGAEAGELPQCGPRHRVGHRLPLPTMDATIVCMRLPSATESVRSTS